MRSTRLAKLTRPRIDGLLPRERLFALLDEQCNRPVVWVHAPPGSGKTSLIASYVAARKRPCLWYQVDSADADPAAFFLYLGTLAADLRSGKRRALPVLALESAADLRGFARLYFRELLSRMAPGSVLVLDNYQELPGDSEIQPALAIGLEEVPDGINVIIASRSPPHGPFAGLRATQRVAELDRTHLNLTLEETARIVGRDLALPEATVRDLHDQTNGWAAGLILMLDRVKHTGQLRDVASTENLESVFDYFAGLLLGATSGAEREMLLRMSYLPRLNAELASAISGSPEAPQLLLQYSRRNLFVDRHYGQEPSFQFHALFRTFLQNQARNTLEASEHARITYSAAALLEAAGQSEDAYPLYLESRSWEAAGRLVRKEASRLVREGRRLTLREWITTLPMQHIDSDPWLSYWLAVTELPMDRAGARQRMSVAYDRFRTLGDFEGMVVCASMAADSFFSDGWVGVDIWIDRLRFCLNPPTDEVPPGVVAAGLHSLTRAMCFHALGDETLPAVVDRVLEELDEAKTAHERVRAVGVLMLYFWLQGDADRCEVAYRKLPPDWMDAEAPVSDRLFCAYFSLCHLFASGARDDARLLMAGIDRLTDEFHLAPLRVEFQYVSALPLIQDGLIEEARDLLDKRVRPFLTTARPMAAAWYHALLAVCELGLGRTDVALASFRYAIDHCMERENTASRSMMEPGYAFVLLAAGNTDMGLVIVQGLRDRLPRNPRVEWIAVLAEAYVAMKSSQEDRLREHLHRMAVMLPRIGHYGIPWNPIIVPSLLAAALVRGIAVDAVRALIEKFQIRSPDPNLSAWPWPVRLQALGPFRILNPRQHKPRGAKAQHRLLALLRLLVASGAQGASSQMIVDNLWPDSDGDRGNIALQVSLHRLRKLLGREEAVETRDGKVALNARVCWIDAWAFEQAASRALAPTTDGPRREESARAALDLYGGHLLAQESEPGMVDIQRERLRRQWLALIRHQAQTLEGNADDSAAEALYQRALEIDPAAEDLYRLLMSNLLRRAAHGDALEVYRRCRTNLLAVSGATPSPETERLRERIVDENG